MGGTGRSWACSARPGCGKRGLAPGVSGGGCRCGLAQDVAHQREAYFGNSHIFSQPVRARVAAQ